MMHYRSYVYSNWEYLIHIRIAFVTLLNYFIISYNNMEEEALCHI